MLVQKVQPSNIIYEVKKAVSSANYEILATMLLSEEVNKPLPKSYHELLQKKISNGIRLRRLGFGTKKDYLEIKNRVELKGKYIFRYDADCNAYQRLIIIDQRVSFFGVGDSFFTTAYKPLVKAFCTYFLKQFKKAEV